MAVNSKSGSEREQSRNIKEQRNEDPLSGEAGAHPIGTGVGAALGGAATGAIAGTVAGPIGTVVGAVVGSVAGGLAGKAVAEGYDPTIEAAYWQDEYRNRPYYNDEYSYDHYEPAYRAGWESYDSTSKSTWKDREETARQRWEDEGGPAHMTWEEARQASQDAYSRVSTPTTKRAR